MAQKLSTTGRPRKSESETVFPDVSASWKSGAAAGPEPEPPGISRSEPTTAAAARKAAAADFFGVFSSRRGSWVPW